MYENICWEEIASVSCHMSGNQLFCVLDQLFLTNHTRFGFTEKIPLCEMFSMVRCKLSVY